MSSIYPMSKWSDYLIPFARAEILALLTDDQKDTLLYDLNGYAIDISLTINFEAFNTAVALDIYPETFENQPELIAIVETAMATAFHDNIDHIVTELLSSENMFIFALLEIPNLRFTQAEFEKHAAFLFELAGKGVNAIQHGSRRAAGVNLLLRDAGMEQICKRNRLPYADILRNGESLLLCDREILPAFYVLMLRTHLKEFMTGEFTWGLHNGLEYKTTSMFSGLKAVQIPTS